MSATQDLIAAALTAADLLDDMWLLPQDSREGEKLREACALAMVEPDMAEVERLADEYATAVHDGRDNDCYKTRTALLDYVRNHFVEADKMVSAAESVTCSKCGHENWIMPGKAPAQITDADKRSTTTQPVGEVPMPQVDMRGPTGTGDYFNGYTPSTLRNYGEQCRAAGYAAGGKDADRYRWLRDTGDATWRPFAVREGYSAKQADAAIDAALRGEVKP